MTIHAARNSYVSRQDFETRSTNPDDPDATPYRADHETVRWLRKFLDTLCPYPNPPMARILDAGCGYGRFCYSLQGMYSSYVGVDPVKARIERAKKLWANVFPWPTFHCIEEGDWTFPEAPCNVAILIDVLQHLDVPGAVQLLANVGRCLLPGSIILIWDGRLGRWTEEEAERLYADSAEHMIHKPIGLLEQAALAQAHLHQVGRNQARFCERARMKIVSVCRVYPTHRPGGMPFVCECRAEALAREGHQVKVLTTRHPTAGSKFIDCRSRDLSIEYIQTAQTEEYSAGFAEECAEICRFFHPDIIHLDSFDGQRPWWIERPGGAKRIAITMHGFGMGAFLTKWNEYRCGRSYEPPTFDAEKIRTEAALLSKADAVLAISRHEEWMLRDCYGLSNVKLVYNPIPEYFFDSPPTDPPAPMERRFLCAAISGATTRGFDVAMKAAEGLCFEKRLDVLSALQRHEMPAAYDLCSAVLLPTFYAQGYDLTVAEAFARRRPVIASATGSYLRESEHRPGFVIVPAGDVEALKRAMTAPLPVVPAGAADIHRPERHVEQWLQAVCPA